MAPKKKASTNKKKGPSLKRTVRKHFSYLYNNAEGSSWVKLFLGLRLSYTSVKYDYSFSIDDRTGIAELQIGPNSSNLITYYKQKCMAWKKITTGLDYRNESQRFVTYVVFFFDPFDGNAYKILYFKFPEASRDGGNKDSPYLVMKVTRVSKRQAVTRSSTK